MPRQARIILPGVCYHVISRGNERQPVFKNTDDYERYMDLLGRYKCRYSTRLYGWCLMLNHVHLIVESDNLCKFMHGIGTSYTKYFRYKYNGTGHLWQDRFKSYIIQKDSYAINCINYVEYNPVRAQIVDKPESYPWSSYNQRVLGSGKGLLDTIAV